MIIDMFGLSPIVTGITLLITGLGFLGLTAAMIVVIPKFTSNSNKSKTPPFALHVPPISEAVLVIKNGGRLIYLNDEAKKLFGITKGKPNLNHLIQRTNPKDTFLSLCTTEGQAHFTVNGRVVVGKSHFTPLSENDNTSGVLLSLHKPRTQHSLSKDDDIVVSDDPDVTISIFKDISQAISYSLDFNDTIKATLDSIDKLISHDNAEILIMDQDKGILTPYHLTGLPGTERKLKQGQPYKINEKKFTAQVLKTRKQLLINNIIPAENHDETQDVKPYRSFLGNPLILDTSVIGAIELYSFREDNFSLNDQEILRIISHQAALAIHNSKLFKVEKRRADELSGLANLAQTVSALQDPEDLYALFIDIISPLVNANIIGFLLYDRNRKILQGQIPFKGIQANAIQWFQTIIEPNSKAEEIIQTHQIILTENPLNEENIIALGLHHICQAAGIKNTALIPLTSGGRMLGYLQIANKSDGSLISEDDLRIIKIIAGQAAPIIENSTLVQESKKRAHRADTLRRITKLTNSSATIEEILKFSILDLARLIQADILAVFILDESNESVNLHFDSSFGIPPDIKRNIQSLQIGSPDFINTITFTKKQFHEGDLFQVEKPPYFVQPFIEDLQIRSAINLPLVTRGRGFGEIVIGSFKPNFFDKNDLLTVTSVAAQLASAIEKSKLYSQTDESLQKRIDKLTELTFENARLLHASERRSKQLQALTEISTSISGNLEFDELITMLLNLFKSVLPFDTGTLWLLNDQNQVSNDEKAKKELIVFSAYGFADNEQRIGLTVNTEDSELFNEMINSAEPILVGDVSKDNRFLYAKRENLFENFDIPVDNSLLKPENLTWLGIPLIASGKVIGVIALEKKEANAYTLDDLQVSKTFASQSAAALENARLFQASIQTTNKLNQQSQKLNLLYNLSIALNRSLDINEILSFTTQELIGMLGCSSATAFLYKDKDVLTDSKKDINGKEVSYLELVSEYFADKQQTSTKKFVVPVTEIPFLFHLKEGGGILNFKDARNDETLLVFQEFLEEHNTIHMLVIPIITTSQSEEIEGLEQQFHGLLIAHRSDDRRFSSEELELAKTISNQVAIAIQNARLYAETRNLYEDLEHRVQERTSELQREHHRTQTLLKIISELSASLDFEQVLNRTLKALNEFVDAEQITVLITRPEQKKLIRLASLGYAPRPEKGGSVTPLDKDQGLAGWVITHADSVLIDDVLKDNRWVKLPIPGKVSTVSRHRSALGVPLMSSSDAIGALMMYHRETSHFNKDQLELVEAVARQIGVAINNAELYRIIRDQAESMGSMLREQQIENSKSIAILESVADGILVTNADKTITLINQSAERILELDRNAFLGKPLEVLSGIFGLSTVNWIKTINRWSNNPGSIIEEEKLSEKISLENGNVISVHLAPVSLRGEFLGTVSVFQDITHEVEVDRLKSEFVATVSHELRTPMTSIKGYAEILLMGAAGELNPQQRKFIEVVKMNTDRLTVLVNDLLDVSKIEAGKIVLSLQPINLIDVINDAIHDINKRSEEENKPIEVKNKTTITVPRVVGDKNRVRQIIDNLLMNAYQYSLENGEITIELHRLETEVQIDISDKGIGIRPEDQSRIFERFYRGENSLNFGIPGTGLGLPIVKNLIEMHGGRIWVESKGIPGKGSTFSFTLPIYKQSNNITKNTQKGEQ